MYNTPENLDNLANKVSDVNFEIQTLVGRMVEALELLDLWCKHTPDEVAHLKRMSYNLISRVEGT